MEKQKKYLYMIYMGVTLWHLWHSRCHKSGTEKNFYIYMYIYINLPKLGFYRLDTVPFRPCIFTDFLILYIFCTKMSYLSVLSYVYTYGRKKKIKKKHGAEKEKIFYIYKYKPYDISAISAILVYFLYNFYRHLPKNF